MENIKLAIAPIGWSNDDLPELGGHIPFEQCIREMAEAEFQGCEVGNKFPRDPAELKAALQPLKLSVASAWYSTYFTESNRQDETIQGFLNHMHFLKAMGAKVIVVSECGHAIQGKPLAILDHQPSFNSTEWQALIDGLHTIGKLAQAEGMQIVYHHHMGTGIQSKAEIDKLMQQTDPNLVSLLFDTGHLYFANENPIAVLKNHHQRIKHVHLKDIRRDVLNQTREQQMSFLTAVKSGVFTVPGDGCIDFKPILALLKAYEYQGWLVVEAEQDPEKAPPLEYAKKARKYLREMIGW